MKLCQVLNEDPELAEAVPPALRERAIQECTARTLRLGRGRWRAEQPFEPDGIGLLVLDGLLLRRVGIDGRWGTELLGAGDLLRPWQGRGADSTLIHATGWRVLIASRLAVLDREFERRIAAYPPLIGALVGRSLERARNLAINLAIVHQARVSVRLQMLFWHLADRWGRVGPDGVILPLALPHTVLSDLVAAQRPTVTSCLGELAREGLVVAHPGGWLLPGEPPGELLALQPIAVPSAAGG